MNVITEKKFTPEITLGDARVYLEATLRDISKMKISVTWGFDELQADPFHHSWTGEKFIQCVKKLVEEK